MSDQLVDNAPDQLRSFITFLYEGLEGYIYVADKNPDPDYPTDFHQSFYHYPGEIDRLEEAVIRLSSEREVYISPAVYSQQSAKKEYVYASNVVWTEFDGNAPEITAFHTEPSLMVCSSQAGHQHVYWRLSEPIFDVAQLEEINRNISYCYSADSSGWDATQVLRPPKTKNHKRGHETSVSYYQQVSYDSHVFQNLPTAPPLVNAEDWAPSVIPDVASVILKYSFDPQQIRLFRASLKEVRMMFPQEGRSAALMQLGYFGCEMGMSDPEIFSMLLNADERWGKFRGRPDQKKRLAEIISRARIKHPYTSEEEDTASAFIIQVFDYVSFLNTEIEIDWVVENMLMENGYMLLTGPSGLGKTQLSMQFAHHLALGKDFLGYNIEKPRKILFLSLEMGHKGFKHFLQQMAGHYTKDELEQLEENFIIIPHGEAWYMDQPVGQDRLRKVLDEIEPDGLFIDSIGSSISGSISQEEPVKKLVDFNDKIVKHHDLFTWWIHHMRKSQGDNKRPETMDDVYGNQYLVNRSSSTYGLFKGAGPQDLRLKCLKMRLAEVEEPFVLERIMGLNFKRKNAVSIDMPSAQAALELAYKKPEEEKGPSTNGHNDKPGGNFLL